MGSRDKLLAGGSVSGVVWCGPVVAGAIDAMSNKYQFPGKLQPSLSRDQNVTGRQGSILSHRHSGLWKLSRASPSR